MCIRDRSTVDDWFSPTAIEFYTQDQSGTEITAPRFTIASDGDVGINTDFTGSQTWRAGKRLEIFGGGGNVTGELHIGANRGDGAQSVGSINFFDNTQDSTHRHIAIIEADKSGSTSNKRGGDLLFYTKNDNTAAPTEKLRIKSDGHVIIDQQLGVGGQDPGGSTLKVHGNINLSQGGNTTWQKVTMEGSGGTSGDAISINNWGDAEGDYWMIGVNQTMNSSGNYSKTNSGKRTSFVTIDGRMGRVYLGGASTSGNPTEHFYTNWDGTVYMNSGFGSNAPFYGVRAWVQGSGSGSANGSGGLSSVSRPSTGRFLLTFATTMPDTNYAIGCLGNNNYSDTSWHNNEGTDNVSVYFYSNGGYQNPSKWSAWVMR